ncbi:DNA cytosine methyltransferase [Helicobacter pylori]|uniref:DNA cytosine methyltransferase n=1 Tax=Helicobacter pylori TaxID=210 RepID=UPI002FBEA6E0
MLFNQTLTYISLFSGAGVGCYGLLEEGFECVATNEILEKRLNIQRINRKCKLDESYISGDIKKPETKEKILKQIGFYSKKFGNDRVDLVVATPPCQGMSVANHKKKNDEIKRNSLVVESIDLIKQIKPRFFILENVPSFYKTGCIDKNDNLLEIGSMIEQNLSGDYMLYDEVINFKNFGANSSRTRTLVIGVCKEFKDFTSALEFFPDFKQEKTLKEVIGSLKPLTWGEYDSADFYHSFRTYPKHMQEWIKDLKEGQSAFENTELNKKPHRIVGNKIVLNVSKNGDKHKRQKYHSVAQTLEINMIIGGPPCQGFSNKGKNLGLKDPRNFLFLEYIEIVKAIKPEIFIIENVKNLISCAKGYFLEEIKERLNALGYQLSYQILNAKDYGVPQNRERAFIVGASRFSFDFNLLEPSQSVNIQEAISDLAYLCSNEGAFESDYLNPIQSSYQALMRKNSPKLYNHQATNHSQAALEKLKLINKEQGKECLPKNLHGKQQFKSTWGRLNWNKISPTIDTRFDTPSNGTNSHPKLHRSITPREAARIQSFSDTYIFYGNKTSVCKQIGNAVPPLLALALGKAILKSARNDTNPPR